ASGANPADVLAAFEAAAAKRPGQAGTGDDLTQYMVRFESIPELAESAKAIQKILVEGRYSRRSDANFITQNIERLIVNQIGYADVAPYLQKVQATNQSPQIKEAAGRSLSKLGATGATPDASFYDLAEKLYAGKSAIAADERNPTAFVWYWTEAAGLQRKEVP